MNIYKINTTAYEEEDFYVMTTLPYEKIKYTLTTIVRGVEDAEYDNDSLVDALQSQYPNDIIIHISEIEKITI